jgi:hypothetical protein
VLVAILIVKNNFTGEVELHYQPVTRHSSMATCNIENDRLMKKPENGITFICLRIDYE